MSEEKARLVIEIDKHNKSFTWAPPDGVPVDTLVNIMEVIKTMLISQQLLGLKVRDQRPQLVMPAGPLPQIRT